MLPVAGFLVVCLYMSLTEELLSHVLSSIRTNKVVPKCTMSHATMLNRQKQNQAYQTKKPFLSLDGLWKRMRNATEQFRLINARQEMVSTKMAEARVEAREAEAERIAAERLQILKMAFGPYS